MNLQIQENIPLYAYTTLKIGGVARYFVEVQNVEEVKFAVQLALQKKLPILVLGAGSNLLISDTGFEGLVIKNNIKGLWYTEDSNGLLMKGGAGEMLDEVVEYFVARGYSGLENLSAIPSTLGATPVQNVGAYGVEISDVLEKVYTIDITTGMEKIFTNKECNFSYRDSFFKTTIGKKYFITHVSLRLKKNSAPKISYADLAKIFVDIVPTIKEVRDAVIKIRNSKFPDWRVLGNAGSFFKNPIITKTHYEQLMIQYESLPAYESGEDMVKIPLGYVLDRICGLRGYRVGAVGLYEAQALVLVNYGGATEVEVKKFVAEITKKVFDKTKIKIEPEVNFI